MDVIWLAFVFGFPALCATYAFDKVYAARGPAAFKNPGGWKFPLGEVAMFGGGFAGMLLVLVVAAVVS